MFRPYWDVHSLGKPSWSPNIFGAEDCPYCKFVEIVTVGFRVLSASDPRDLLRQYFLNAKIDSEFRDDSVLANILLFRGSSSQGFFRIWV